MKLDEVNKLLQDKQVQIQENQPDVDPSTIHLYGVDVDRSSYGNTLAELKRIKKHNRRLYDKIVNLG